MTTETEYNTKVVKSEVASSGEDIGGQFIVIRNWIYIQSIL